MMRSLTRKRIEDGRLKIAVCDDAILDPRSSTLFRVSRVLRQWLTKAVRRQFSFGLFVLLSISNFFSKSNFLSGSGNASLGPAPSSTV